MSIEPAPTMRPLVRLRADRPERGWIDPDILARVAFVALASGFVLVAGGNLDPGEIESRLGLASH